MIEIKAFQKYYGTYRGVEHLDMSIKAGEVYGFIGPNGAGKSTTIRAMLGFIKPTSGDISLFGEPINDLALSRLKQKIGYLPSEVHYYDNMKVKDFLSYTAKYYHKDCTLKQKSLCVDFDLNPERFIEDLSYGNKKKVGIIQALMHDPELLILDEPTGGLDPLMQNIFFEHLKKENKAGKTLFFSSHILSEVQKVCHRVGIIKDGRMIHEDNIAGLKKAQYKKVHVTLPPETPLNLNGLNIRDLKQSGESASFIYEGDANELISALSANTLLDFSAEEPDLEEIFMHFYSEVSK